MDSGLEKAVNEALISYQREGMKKRYSPEIIKSFGYGIPDSDVLYICGFVLDKLYPDIQTRKEHADYFESLKSFTKPDVAATALFSVGPIILRHGLRIRKLAGIIIDALAVHSVGKKIDDLMVSCVMRSGYEIDENFQFSEELYNQAYYSVSIEKRKKSMKCSIKLVNYFKERGLMTELSTMLDEVAAAVEKRPERLSRQLSAVCYARNFIGDAASFFTKKKDADIDLYARIIERIETEHMERMYSGCRN